MEIKYKSKSKNSVNDVIYHNAVILSQGTWNQQDKKSKMYYPITVLRRDANKWKRYFIYVVHTKRIDGTPSDPLNICGIVDDPRFDENIKAIVGDLRIFASSARGKEIVDKIDRGIIQFLSPEVRTWDKMNYYLDRNEVKRLEFNGVALVIDNPACKNAKIDKMRKTVENV
jgi:hypothetical protein